MAMDTSKLTEKAREAVQKRNYAYALDLYQQSLALNPDNVEARRELRAVAARYVKENGISPGSSWIKGLGPLIRILVFSLSKKNAEKLALLKEKLESTTDPDIQAKIAEAMKDQKLMSLEIGAKERMIQMKKLELEMSKEDDAVRKAEMEKKLLQLKAESEDYLKKVEQLRKQEQSRKAEEKAKQGAEKK